MKNFVFIAEFKNRVSFYQLKAKNRDVAFVKWIADFVNQPFVSKMQARGIIAEFRDVDNNPCQIDGLSNVFRWAGLAWGKYLSVEYVEAMDMREEKEPYIYTFMLYLAGGTYISQHNGKSLQDAYNQWHSYFIHTPYVTADMKEKLKEWNINTILSSMEISECLCRLKLCVADFSFELFITKVRP
mgnify:FL=1